MIGLDDAISQVEKLYQTVVGRPPPTSDKPYAPIPVEADPVRQVEQELDRLLGMLGQGRVPQVAPPPFTPPVTVWESGNEILFSVDLPGVRREQVNVTLQGNAVVVTGLRAPPTQNGHQLRLAEAPLGRFRRVLSLPLGTRGSGLSAQLRDGILEIRVPRDTSQLTTGESIPVT